VAQSTLVLQIPAEARGALRARLEAEERFDLRSVPHALVSVRGEGVVATLYASGKLVIQGLEPESFARRWVDGAATAADAPAPRAAPVATLGSDECGKGDYFGPLVVAAVRLEPEDAASLRGSGVRDSKTISDEGSLRLGAALRSRFPHAIARIEPARYNEMHRRKGQLNDMLADLHVQALRELARPGIRVVVDQFGPERLLRERLADLDVRLEQRPRAESEPAVAAASVIAREEFLLALKSLSEEHGVDLHKGAGDPVDRAARRFVALHGREALGRVAKLHFKNTQRV